MSKQTKHCLSFADILQKSLSKEIYVSCNRNQAIFKGILTKINRSRIVLNVKNKQYLIPFSDIYGIDVLDLDNEITSIEAKSPSNTSNRFYQYLNQYIDCTSNKQWTSCGIITYVGKDYVTFFDEEHSTHIRVVNSPYYNIYIILKKTSHK